MRSAVCSRTSTSSVRTGSGTVPTGTSGWHIRDGGYPSARLREPVADAAHVLGHRRAHITQLRTQAREMRLEPFGIGIALVRPARPEELLARDHLGAAPHQDLQQAKLDGREL